MVVEANDGRVPVVLGLGGNNTREIINTIEETDFQYVDAILSVSPYYNRPPQKGIFLHYRTIANASPVPVILYSVPARTGSAIEAETTLELAHEVKNIIGVKEASGNLDRIAGNRVRKKASPFRVRAGGRQPLHVINRLGEHRNAVERTAKLAKPCPHIRRASLVERGGGQHIDRVQRPVPCPGTIQRRLRDFNRGPVTLDAPSLVLDDIPAEGIGEHCRPANEWNGEQCARLEESFAAR
jgi:hypothetical protein